MSAEGEPPAESVARAAARGICNSCLGRIFGGAAKGQPSAPRGERLRAGAAPAPAPGECWLCEGTSDEVEALAKVAEDALAGYEFESFLVGTTVGAILTVWFTSLTSASLGLIISLNVILFLCALARMVSSFALSSALPNLPDRGAYMAITSSLQQLAGGIASWSAGLVVYQATPVSKLEGYARLGWLSVVAMAITIVLMGNVHRIVTRMAAR